MQGQTEQTERVNVNCLEHFRCPECRQADEFRIEASTVFEVTDDGTGDHGDVEWDNASWMLCPRCEKEGPLSSFRTDLTGDPPQPPDPPHYFRAGEIERIGGFHSKSKVSPNEAGWFYFEPEHSQWAGPFGTMAVAILRRSANPPKLKNTSCLMGMKCPKCGSLGPFGIGTFATAIVADDGIKRRATTTGTSTRVAPARRVTGTLPSQTSRSTTDPPTGPRGVKAPRPHTPANGWRGITPHDRTMQDTEKATVSRGDVFACALEALRTFESEHPDPHEAMADKMVRDGEAARLEKLWEQAIFDDMLKTARRDIEEACKLIRRAKHRLGYCPEPPPDLDHPWADEARRIREAQTTLDLALEELGWEVD